MFEVDAHWRETRSKFYIDVSAGLKVFTASLKTAIHIQPFTVIVLLQEAARWGALLIVFMLLSVIEMLRRGFRSRQGHL